jgi:phosphoribosyl-ATP pyrophosphohydrolase
MSFEEMVALAQSRKRDMPEGKSTTALFEGGAHAIGKKLVEEAAESWMAARYETDAELAMELSQVLYYVACMMAERGIAMDEVYARL